jgi:hypothetical protein
VTKSSLLAKCGEMCIKWHMATMAPNNQSLRKFLLFYLEYQKLGLIQCLKKDLKKYLIRDTLKRNLLKILNKKYLISSKYLNMGLMKETNNLEKLKHKRINKKIKNYKKTS